MNEYSPRPAHRRHYIDSASRTASMDVNDHGLVVVTEELLDQLLTGNDFTELVDKREPITYYGPIPDTEILDSEWGNP